jgi:FtsZ-binding cell division protein ZapB
VATQQKQQPAGEPKPEGRERITGEAGQMPAETTHSPATGADIAAEHQATPALGAVIGALLGDGAQRAQLAAALTPKRPSRRTPGWAWIAIALLALAIAGGAITLAVVRSSEPSAPQAVAAVTALQSELEAMNENLATTNELMSNAITNGEKASESVQARLSEASANAQSKLAGLSARLEGIGSRAGQIASLLGAQLSGRERGRLGKAQERLHSRLATLAARRGQLQGQQVAGLRHRVGRIGGTARTAASSTKNTVEAKAGERAKALESKAGERAKALEAKAGERATAVAAQANRRAGTLESRVSSLEQKQSEIRQLRARVQADRGVLAGVEARLRAMRSAQQRLQALVERLRGKR